MDIKNAVIIAIVLYGAYWFITHWGKKVPMGVVPPFKSTTPAEDKMISDQTKASEKQRAADEKARQRASDKSTKESSKNIKEAQPKAPRTPADSTSKAPVKQSTPTPDTTSKQPVQDNTAGKFLQDAFNNAGKAIQNQIGKTFRDPLGQLYEKIVDPLSGEEKVVPIAGYAGAYNVDGDLGLTVITIMAALGVILFATYKEKHRKKRR